ncbi:sterol desaturase family protein [Flammeovirgaceae bacterium SG7u.111]|nr:sterol desaturase family protein [Flammeovirgaceae bacterium SG7u.132]WPO37001.1 sterol desaturase family protein [Flammeovirgaceae bacterium SG7u.111]
MEVTNPLTYAVPFFLTFIVIEIVLSLKHEKHLYYWNDLFASISMGGGAAILAIFTKAATFALFWATFELFKPLRMAWFGYESFGYAWYVWIICQFLDDHNYYWHHRLSHTVRVLWAAHVVHHSSEYFNFGSGIRNGWFTLFYKPLSWMWLAVIGFEPLMIVTCLGIQAVYQFQLHTQSVPHLGFLEKFMNTPRQHQVHHSCNYEYLDKNHGGFLNIFDRLYGTFHQYDEKIEPKFGVLHPPESYNPFVIAFHEFKEIAKDVKKSKNLKHSFMYIFGPPGWSPDGSTKTARQIQRELFEKMDKQSEAQLA